MAQLVGKGKHVVKVFLIVHQNIRVNAVGSPRIGTAGLTAVFQPINPTVSKGLFEILQVGGTQGLQPFLHHGYRLLPGDRLLFFPNQGYVNIVHMKLIYTQEALAQIHVLVEQTQVVVDRLMRLR